MSVVTAKNFWSKWEKPWTIEQTRRRYVEGDRVNLPDLTDECGLGFGKVRTASKKDKWVDQRKQFQHNLNIETQKKSIEKTSDRLSDELADILVEHYQAHNAFRQLSSLYADVAKMATNAKIQTLNKLKQARGNPEEIIKAQDDLLKSFLMIANTTEAYSRILERATKGERVAIGADVEQNISKAFQVVEAEGMLITDPLEIGPASDEVIEAEVV